MSYALFKVPALPKFDPAFTPPPDLALLSVLARRDIIITVVNRCQSFQGNIHRLLEPVKAACIAAAAAKSSPDRSRDTKAANAEAAKLEASLNRELDASVSNLIDELATIVRMRYIHIPKRAHGAPEHAGYVRGAREHNGLLYQTREFAVAMLTVVSKDRTASTSNTTDATNILIRLATPLVDPADFNPTAAASAASGAASDAAAAPAVAAKAATPSDAPAATAAAMWPANSPLPIGPILDHNHDGAAASPLNLAPAPTPTPAPTQQRTKPRDLQRKVEASNSAALMGRAV